MQERASAGRRRDDAVCVRSAFLSQAMSKSLKKKSHWTNKVHESVLSRTREGELRFELRGGAEIGQFPVLGGEGTGGTRGELLLEVNDTPVVGLTTRDVQAVVRHCRDPVRLKCVKQVLRSTFLLLLCLEMLLLRKVSPIRQSSVGRLIRVKLPSTAAEVLLVNGYLLQGPDHRMSGAAQGSVSSSTLKGFSSLISSFK
ncbi:unnamed protein product [Boreogadus saida]